MSPVSIPNPPSGFPTWLDYLCAFEHEAIQSDLNRNGEITLRNISATLCARAELQAIRERAAVMEKALLQLAGNKICDDNCASVEVASRRVANLARVALTTAALAASRGAGEEKADA